MHFDQCGGARISDASINRRTPAFPHQEVRKEEMKYTKEMTEKAPFLNLISIKEMPGISSLDQSVLEDGSMMDENRYLHASNDMLLIKKKKKMRREELKESLDYLIR